MIDETTSQAKALKALGDPTRLRIIQFLGCCPQCNVIDEDGSCGPTASEVCCTITGAEKINSTISHHLHELKGAGLIEIERKGKSMICTLNKEALAQLGQFVISLSKGENPCL
ncbi:MAG: helix-turn-helix transcriptional regulator [Fimbriimonadaceae bacterium]|nr:helix-turn-helix transcriptional regulator [Fimbriimonadaceae bacterium]